MRLFAKPVLKPQRWGIHPFDRLRAGSFDGLRAGCPTHCEGRQSVRRTDGSPELRARLTGRKSLQPAGCVVRERAGERFGMD